MPFERLWEGRGTLGDAELSDVAARALHDRAVMDAAWRWALDEGARYQRLAKPDATSALGLDEQIRSFCLALHPRSVWQDWNEIRAQINRHADETWLASLIAVRRGEWTIKRERHYVDLGDRDGKHLGFWAWTEHARRGDGATVRLTHEGRRGDAYQYYRYDNDGWSAEIAATREDNRGIPTDVFSVPVILPFSTTRAQALAVTEALRTALLALPPCARHEDYPPPAAVRFDWSFWNKHHPDQPVT